MGLPLSHASFLCLRSQAQVSVRVPPALLTHTTACACHTHTHTRLCVCVHVCVRVCICACRWSLRCQLRDGHAPSHLTHERIDPSASASTSHDISSPSKCNVCSERGLLQASGESRQFSVSLLVVLRQCSSKSSLRFALSASKEDASDAVTWDISIRNCRLTVSVPGSTSTLKGPIEPNKWTHVALLTEDLSFDPLGESVAADSWPFRTHLIIAGLRGSQSTVGHVKYEGPQAQLHWASSRVCLFNDHPDRAEFAQMYIVSRQLSSAEVKHVRERSYFEQEERGGDASRAIPFREARLDHSRNT